MKKKIFGLMTAVCSAVALIPAISVQANAADTDPVEKLYVGSEQIVNGSTINESEITFGSGTVKYDSTTNTLTLNSATIGGADHSQFDAAIYAKGSLNIHLVGNSTVTVSDSTSDSYSNYGIRVDQGDSADGSITFTADTGASLNVTAGGVSGSGKQSTGIYCYGNIDFKSGTITATGGTSAADSSYGIVAWPSDTTGTITVSGTASVTGNGGTAANANSYGLYAHVYNITGGTVKGTGGEADAMSYGVFTYASSGSYTGGGINISAGTLIGEGGKSNDTTASNYGSYGIFTDVDSPLNASGTAIVTGTGGEAEKQSAGVYAKGDLTVSGTASVTGNGGSAETGESNGVYVQSSNLVVSNSAKITGTGGTAADNTSDGIYVRSGNFTVNGNAKITGKGGTSIGTGDEANSYGIRVYYGTLTVNGGTVECESSESRVTSAGIYIYEGKLVQSGGTITATGNTSADSNSYGIDCAYSASIEQTGGTMTGIGGESKGSNSYGIYASSGLSTTGGEMKGTAGKADKYSTGICVYGGLTITNADITGVGAQGGTYSYGLFLDKVTISSGTLTGKGENIDTGDSCGIHCTTDGITQTGGTVIGEGGTSANGESIGISTYNSGISISAGKLTATGGTAGTASVGITTQGDITVSGTASVTGKGGASDADSCGIILQSSSTKISVSDTASVTAVGGNGVSSSYGISGETELTNGTFVAEGNKAAFRTGSALTLPDKYSWSVDKSATTLTASSVTAYDFATYSSSLYTKLTTLEEGGSTTTSKPSTPSTVTTTTEEETSVEEETTVPEETSEEIVETEATQPEADADDNPHTGVAAGLTGLICCVAIGTAACACAAKRRK